MSALIPAAALLLALLIDRLWGEPPVRLHPVVWMGNYLGWAGERVQRGVRQRARPVTAAGGTPIADTPLTGQADLKSFGVAALYWCAGAAVFTLAAWQLQALVLALPDLPGMWLAPGGVVGGAVDGTVGGMVGGAVADGASALGRLGAGLLSALLLAGLLKPMLAWAMLKSEVLAVEAALQQSLAAGRERLSWLVSRDTANLSAEEVRESAIESLAENLNDSVVAPIFWFVLLGLPGAVAYRFANTADAMWGYKGFYKGKNWEWAGKWAARVDDALNWLPARLTGLLLALINGVRLADLRREAGKTPSPNSGWPMAAMALALGIRLGKPGVYTLNPAAAEPLPAQTQQAAAQAAKVLRLLVPLGVAVLVVTAWLGL